MSYDYTGYESAFVPTSPGADNSPETERKTQSASNNKTTDQNKKDTDQQQIYQFSGKKNVLNKYRSYTYNVTLAALAKDKLNSPESYRQSELELVILKSGGKGPSAVSAANIRANTDQISRSNSGLDEATKSRIIKDGQRDISMVEGFNKDSPGKFDMFVDGLEIETIMAFTPNGGATQPTQIRFEVIEPYSINGFIEALHVTAVAAGYSNYASASFILKLDFIGYPDDDQFQFTDPKIVDNASRYFVFGFTGLEVEVTERGTRYVCNGVPYNEKAFGQAGLLKKSIRMVGEDVKEILENLMEAVTNQQIKSDEKSKTANTDHDSYSIQFKKLAGNAWQDDSNGKIATAKLVEIGKENTLYQMINPADTSKPNAYHVSGVAQPTPDQQQKSPQTVKYNPKDMAVQFPENSNLHEIIATVIRDSDYVREMIKAMGEGSIPDDSGMVNYFLIRVEVTNKSSIDPDTKKPFQNFKYVVSPFKVHYTSVPMYESQKVDEKKLKKLTVREYNYIYTGLNVDVKNFKLNFNNLYFEAIPAALGNKEYPGAKNAAQYSESPEIKIRTQPVDGTQEQSVPPPPQRTDPTATSVKPPSGYNAALPITDPYSVLARGMHEKLINSTSVLTGELEIIGDPLYLVTGGIGNYNPGQISYGETSDGEAAHLNGQVLISINFRNPIDINSFEQGGMMRFDANRVPFSGVYMVHTAKSSFKDGNFLQRLQVIRVPGQIIDVNLEPSDPADVTKEYPNPIDHGVPDAGDYSPPAAAENYSSVVDQLGRGLPNSGIPGEPSNFTNNPGGLGGDIYSLKNQTFGRSSRDGGLFSGAGSITVPLPGDVAVNLRLNASGLSFLGQTGLENATKVKNTIDLLGGVSKLDATTLAKSVIANELLNANRTINPGSGIGEGASIGISAQDYNLTGSSINRIKGLVSDLDSGNVGRALGLTPNALGGILNQSTLKASALLGSSVDPLGKAALVGLDPSKLSGLSKFASKPVVEIDKFSQVYDNINLNQAYNEGLVLDYIGPNEIKNLPASQPYSIAPNPKVSVSYMQSRVSSGGKNSLSSLYGEKSVENISQNFITNNEKYNILQSVPEYQQDGYVTGYVNQDKYDEIQKTDRANNSVRQLSNLANYTLVNDQYQEKSILQIYGSQSSKQSPLGNILDRYRKG